MSKKQRLDVYLARQRWTIHNSAVQETYTGAFWILLVFVYVRWKSLKCSWLGLSIQKTKIGIEDKLRWHKLGLNCVMKVLWSSGYKCIVKHNVSRFEQMAFVRLQNGVRKRVHVVCGKRNANCRQRHFGGCKARNDFVVDLCCDVSDHRLLKTVPSKCVKSVSLLYALQHRNKTKSIQAWKLSHCCSCDSATLDMSWMQFQITTATGWTSLRVVETNFLNIVCSDSQQCVPYVNHGNLGMVSYSDLRGKGIVVFITLNGSSLLA